MNERGDIMGIQKNNFAIVFPKLAKEWHPNKNGDLKPTDVTAGSNKKVWWLGECGHEWQAIINNRTKGQGCPYCSNHKILIGFNDLATTHPELVREWHSTKNGELKPTNVTYGSHKKVWWECEYGHEWKTAISNRSRGSGCPYCNKNGTSYPEIRLLYYVRKHIDKGAFHRIKIDKVEFDIIFEFECEKYAIEYDGCYSHKNKRILDLKKNLVAKKNGIIIYRLREKPLPFLNDTSIDFFFNAKNIKESEEVIGKVLASITNKKIKIFFDDDEAEINSFSERIKREESLKTKCPEIAKEWHLTKNLKLKPNHVAAKSNIRVWWLCEHGHEWKTTPAHRVEGNGCPICSNKKVLVGFNDLATTHPELVREWHPTKNESLKPTDITYGSNKKVWWLGECGHEWEEIIANRTTKERGCPYCSNHRVFIGFNDLATTHSELAKQWHPTKNGNLKPTDVVVGSNKKVWWICEHGHEWETVINSRVKCGCPYCAGKYPMVGQTDLATTQPELVKQWHPTKNGNLKPTDVTAGSRKRVWWICEHGHEWEAIISNRVKGRGCPVCANQRLLIGFNDLATTHPELAKQWHPTKNGDLKPTDVTAGSGKRVWWVCEHGHEWEVSVSHRKSGTNCPYCCGKHPICGLNDLATTHPELAKEWHPTKNDNLKPTDVVAGSNKKVWWLCKKCGHEWYTKIHHRTNGSRCPKCKK